MKKYGKLLVSLLALVVVIGLASFAYGKLKGQMEPQSLVEDTNKKETDDGATDDTTEAPQDDAAEAEEDQADERQDAIDVKIYDSEGNAVQLSDFYGKPIVMNFWATWCGYCKQEMPDFQSAYEEYGEDVEFLIINATDGVRETREKAAAYLEEEGHTFPAYYDEDRAAAYVYSVSSLPTTVLIDKEGRVAGYAPGLMQKEMLVQALDVLLAE